MNESKPVTTGPWHQRRGAGAHRDLTVSEAAWVLGESAGAVRRMCEQGLLGGWRVVDSSGSSAGLRWHVPAEGLAPFLRADARWRLRALLAGEVSVPPRSGIPGWSPMRPGGAQNAAFERREQR